MPERFKAGKVDDPERYYPGDQYVDWIGVNAFSVLSRKLSNNVLGELISKTYTKMVKTHSQKPFMLSQLGTTNSSDQPKWLLDAYGLIKENFPTIRAVFYMDNTFTKTGDHKLSPEGLESLKQIFKDPYWIMAHSTKIDIRGYMVRYNGYHNCLCRGLRQKENQDSIIPLPPT